MYLSRSIVWGGESWPMVGAIPADARMHPRPQGRGLVVLEETGLAPWSVRRTACRPTSSTMPLSRAADATDFAYRVRRGAGIDGISDGVVLGSLVAGFSHLRDTPDTPWVERFVAFAREQAEPRVFDGRLAVGDRKSAAAIAASAG